MSMNKIKAKGKCKINFFISYSQILLLHQFANLDMVSRSLFFAMQRNRIVPAVNEAYHEMEGNAMDELAGREVVVCGKHLYFSLKSKTSSREKLEAIEKKLKLLLRVLSSFSCKLFSLHVFRRCSQ